MTSVSIPPIICNQPDDVAEVAPLDGFRLRVRFYDGLAGEVHMRSLVHSPSAGVFAQLADPAGFAEVYVEYGVVTWPGEIDLAPDAMYTEIKRNGSGRSRDGRLTGWSLPSPGYLALDLWGKDKDLSGCLGPQFFTRSGEDIPIPSGFERAVKAATAGTTCIGCSHPHYARLVAAAPPVETEHEEHSTVESVISSISERPATSS